MSVIFRSCFVTVAHVIVCVPTRAFTCLVVQNIPRHIHPQASRTWLPRLGKAVLSVEVQFVQVWILTCVSGVPIWTRYLIQLSMYNAINLSVTETSGSIQWQIYTYHAVLVYQQMSITFLLFLWLGKLPFVQ